MQRPPFDIDGMSALRASLPRLAMSRLPASADVVIVGGGISGLAVAQKLCAAGATVAVLEARPRVGGRLLSHTSEDGLVDLGASWRWPNEPRVQSLVTALGMRSCPCCHSAVSAPLLPPHTMRRKSCCLQSTEPCNVENLHIPGKRNECSL